MLKLGNFHNFIFVLFSHTLRFVFKVFNKIASDVYNTLQEVPFTISEINRSICPSCTYHSLTPNFVSQKNK